MRNRFVKTSNVNRFLAAYDEVEHRGAPEASFLVVRGVPGHGKSRCGQWWAVQNDAVHIRMKTTYTANWALLDLLRQLGGQASPRSSTEVLFGKAVAFLVNHPTPIVVDEVEHAFEHNIKALEVFRDVTDITDVPLILIGREYILDKMKNEPQLYRRISGYTEFVPLQEPDTRLCIEQLCEVSIDEALFARLHAESKGFLAGIVQAIKKIERKGKRAKAETVTVAMMQGESLCPDWELKSRKAA